MRALHLLPRLLLLALGASACSAEHRERPPADCSSEDGYEFLVTGAYNTAGSYFAAPSPGLPDPMYASTTMTAADALDPAELCGHTAALIFKTQGNHDWGSLVGTYPRPPAPPCQPRPDGGPPPVMPCAPSGAITLGPDDMDASGYDGISFWARGSYDRAVALLLDDVTSNASAQQCAAGVDQFESDNITPVGNQRPFSGLDGQPFPTACYLSFQIQLVPNPWWTFYTIPFSKFTQGGSTPDARVKPDGIDRSTISRIVIRAPRDAFVENWFANIAWYRNAQ